MTALESTLPPARLPAERLPAEPSARIAPKLVSLERPMLGGRVGIHLRSASPDHVAVARAGARALQHIEAWASVLTRFDPRSELSRLNDSPASTIAIGPTLAAVLDWGRAAEVATDGIVDITLLDQRLEAERGGDAPPIPPHRQWSLARGTRRSAVHRPAGLRFDLDGVAKGWLADRAARLLDRVHGVAVDADGDVSIGLDPGESLSLGVADPASTGMDIAVLRLANETPGRRSFGVATSGISVHRWGGADATARHHLIDPRTGRPAATDIVQATVIATSARLAEAFAKSAVILGRREAPRGIRRPGVLGAVLLTEDRQLLTLPGTERFLA
jgi:thiamine biosynthesis lipoprotein